MYRLGFTEADIDARIAATELTLEKMREETSGVTFAECFRKSNLRRTLVSILPLSIQSLCGITFVMSYLTYYTQLAGYTAAGSFKIAIISVVLGMLGNIGSWFLVGRRDLTIYGLAIITIILVISGGLGTRIANSSYVKGVIALWNVYGFIYNLSIGATAYNFLAEVPTSRPRVKTASIGYALQMALYASITSCLSPVVKLIVLADDVEFCSSVSLQPKRGKPASKNSIYFRWSFFRFVDLPMVLPAGDQWQILQGAG